MELDEKKSMPHPVQAIFRLAWMLSLVLPRKFRKDAKTAASIGLILGWAGWQALLTGTFAGFALAALYGGVRLAMGKATRTSQLPQGSSLFAGALVVLVLS